MKKTLACLLLFIACIIIFTGCTQNDNDNSQIRLEINRKKFTFEVAKSEEKKQKGLAGIKSLDPNKGMIFIFDKSDYLQFWMKDTLIPLQILFINGCEIVDAQETKVGEDPSNPQIIYKSKAPADKAIEVNQNTFEEDIVGQKIQEFCK